MAAQAETRANIFHSLNRDMALQTEGRFRRTEIPPWNDDLALQALARFEWLFGDAIEPPAAEILGGGHNGGPSGLEQTQRPMQRYPLVPPAVTRGCHGATLGNPPSEGRVC